MAKQKLKDDDKTKLLLQCSKEYEHGLEYRHKREQDWQTIDELYYGKKKKSIVSRANIHVPKMQGTIDTFLAKVDDAPYIEFEGQEEGDRPGAARLNSMLRADSEAGDWELIDLLGKKEAALYGRTVTKKFATSENGFTDHHELIDVLDFVIDPLAGGIFPFKFANHCGQDNIIRSVNDLDDKEIYDQKEVGQMVKELHSDSDKDNKFRSLFNRRSALNLSDAVYISEESVRLVEWYTRFQGERYYVLFSPEHHRAVRIGTMKEVFGYAELPFSSWAPFPRAHEFWTPGIGELIKEPNIVQNIILSQMLDNNAYRNYGMVFYDVTKITNPAELVPRPGGKIAVNGSPSDAVKERTFPPLEQGLSMYRLLDSIFAAETGITPNAKGMPNSKRMSATEFAGLLDEVADRFFTANRTYKHHLRRIAKLYHLGLQQNMTKERSVRVLGAKGYEWKKADIRDVNREFDIRISSGAEKESQKQLTRDRFREYRTANAQNPRLNQQFLDEKEARLMGFEDGEIERLMNPDMEGDWEILAEAAAENEELLSGEVEVNRGATSGHIQKHLDFARTTQSLKAEQIARILSHANAEMDYAVKNEEVRAKAKIDEMRKASQPVPQSTPTVSSGAPQGMSTPRPAPVGISPLQNQVAGAAIEEVVEDAPEQIFP